MNRYIILIIAFFLVIALNKAGATIPEYSVVAKSDKNNITIYEGYGTGVLNQEVNVYHIDHNSFGEMLVDHPMSIINKNSKA